MRVALPAAVGDPTRPDPVFAVEHSAAEAAGLDPLLYDCAALWRHEAEAVAAPTPRGAGPVLHRGFMLSDRRFALLRDALAGRGWTLVPDLEGYGQAHFLPRALPLLGDATPRTVWMDGFDPDRAWALYQQVADGDALLKDHVKSCKERWREACLLPARSSRERFDEVLRAFLACRGAKLELGLVLRRVEPFRLLRRDMRGTPVHEEYRTFFWRGAPVWSALQEDLAPWSALARRFRSPFLSLDVARREDGVLRVVESGDGGVTGLPVHCDPDHFYAALAAAIRRDP